MAKEIKQFVDEEHGRVISVIETDHDNAFGDGVNLFIAWGLQEEKLLPQCERMVQPRTASYSEVAEGDSYDEKLGRAISRDKVISKYYGRQEEVLDRYAKALKKELKAAKKKAAYAKALRDGAEKRLQVNIDSVKTKKKDKKKGKKGKKCAEQAYPNQLDGMTEKEIEIAKLYMFGRSVKRIVDDISVPEETVRVAIKTAFDKLGVTSRVGLKDALR